MSARRRARRAVRAMFVVLSLLSAMLVSFAVPASATTLPTGFAETRLPGKLSFPSSMSIAPDGRVFVGDRQGSLWVFVNDVLQPTPVLQLTVDSSGERGLIGITFDPNFTSNGYFYVYYTATTPTIHNRVSRFTLSGNVADPSSEVDLLDLDDLVSNQHNAGALHFGTDGKLYIAVGDNYDSANSQTLATLKGKILRINADGSIPTDNPFYNSATGKNRAIWALGLRNPFTFDVQPGTGRMFIDDVGNTQWEEIDDGLIGSNYGWPQTEGYTTDPRFRSPLYAYGHGSGTSVGCAITGGTFYNPRNPQFPVSYLGDYFFIDYCNGWIKTYDPSTGNVNLFASNLTTANTIYVTTAPDGSLYYLTSADPNGVGGLFKITYTGSLAPQIASQPQSQLVTVGDTAQFSVSAYGNQPLSYQWRANGTPIAGATTPSYTTPATTLADDGTIFTCVVTDSGGLSTTTADAKLSVTSNHAPTVTVTAPTDGASYRAGDTVAFSATATDPEDGSLPASAFQWQVDLHHNVHIHPGVYTTSNVTSGSFTIPATGETSTNVFYRFIVTVTDSGGRTSTAYADVHPLLTQLSLATSPSGLSVNLDGQPVTAPFNEPDVIGMTRTVSAPATQTVGTNTYVFSSWSDGGPATHTITMTDAAMSLTANYVLQPQGSISASPNPIPVGTGTVATTTLSWASSSVTDVEVHVNSPSGNLFARSGPGAVSQTTGPWVSEGMTFYLQNVSGGLPLTAANTLATATVHLQHASGTLSANPSTITVNDGTGLGTTALSWTSANASTVEVHVNAANGPLFSRSGGGSASATTGKWVQDGTKFYLQDVSSGAPLTSQFTLATVTMHVRSGSISASPNPITVSDGSGLGVTNVSWTTTGTQLVEVHVNSPTGSLFSRSSGGSWSATTGKWVKDGTTLYLQDVSGGLPLTAANTLATVRVAVTAG